MTMSSYREATASWKRFLRDRPSLTKTMDPKRLADVELRLKGAKTLRALMSLMRMYFVLGYMMGARSNNE
jgi:hypothetical protein